MKNNGNLSTYYISAYGEAVAEGFTGSKKEWLESLKVKGDPGKSAYETAVEGGYQGTEEQFTDRLANQGKSAYDYAVEGGYTGTPEEFSRKLATENTINNEAADPTGNWNITAESIGAQKKGDYASAAELQNLSATLSAEVDEATQQLQSAIDKEHPVGSWWLSDDPTSPASLFGGDWEQLKDRMLVGAGNWYSVRETGGESRHTLTIQEMPSHTHGVKYAYNPVQHSYPQNTLVDCVNAQTDWQENVDGVVERAGGGIPHNNMPPFYATYIWRRTA